MAHTPQVHPHKSYPFYVFALQSRQQNQVMAQHRNPYAGGIILKSLEKALTQLLDSHKFALGHFLVNTFIIAWFLLLAN